MKSRATLLMAVLVLIAGCSGVQPVQIAAGDVCFECRRAVAEPRIATELIDQDGRAFKFHSAGCMARFLKKNPAQQSKGIFATDYATGRMVKVSAVKFVPTMIGEGRERTLDYVAYYAAESAAEAAAKEKTEPVNWDGVLSAVTP